MSANWERPRDATGRWQRPAPRPLIDVLADCESELRDVDHQLTQLHIRNTPLAQVVVMKLPHAPAPEHWDTDDVAVPTWLWCALSGASGWCVAQLVDLAWHR